MSFSLKSKQERLEQAEMAQYELEEEVCAGLRRELDQKSSELQASIPARVRLSCFIYASSPHFNNIL